MNVTFDGDVAANDAAVAVSLPFSRSTANSFTVLDVLLATSSQRPLGSSAKSHGDTPGSAIRWSSFKVPLKQFTSYTTSALVPRLATYRNRPSRLNARCDALLAPVYDGSSIASVCMSSR